MEEKAILEKMRKGDEQVKDAAMKEMRRLKEGGLSDEPRKMQEELPFLAACDTRFGDKQTYKMISRHCRQFHELYFDRKTGLYRVPGCKEAEGLVLKTLVDTIEEMDMQLYEHYRALADLFFEAARGLISHETEATAMAADALQKGVRLGLLDEEKYLPIALKMKEAACGEGKKP